MGKEFYEQFEICRQTYEEASDILHMDMKKKCFEDSDELNQTKNAQPALLTTQIAIFRAISQIGIRADYLAGLSCGKYSAVTASGGMQFSDALRLVHKKGIFMQEAAPEGTTLMAAVIGLPAGMVEEICGETCGRAAVTNYNCPGQVVVGGYKEDVEYVMQKSDEAGAVSVSSDERPSAGDMPGIFRKDRAAAGRFFGRGGYWENNRGGNRKRDHSESYRTSSG